MSDVAATIADLIERTTGIPTVEIEPASRFAAMGNWTSLAALQLLTRIEEHFVVKLDLRAYFAVNDVAGLVSLVGAALEERGVRAV
jgi:acyl carrier protein